MRVDKCPGDRCRQKKEQQWQRPRLGTCLMYVTNRIVYLDSSERWERIGDELTGEDDGYMPNLSVEHGMGI